MCKDKHNLLNCLNNLLTLFVQKEPRMRGVIAKQSE